MSLLTTQYQPNDSGAMTWILSQLPVTFMGLAFPGQIGDPYGHEPSCVIRELGG